MIFNLPDVVCSQAKGHNGGLIKVVWVDVLVLKTCLQIYVKHFNEFTDIFYPKNINVWHAPNLL